MALAVGRIADAVQRGERIGVFGDYDVDGVTTAALLTSFLRASGAHVECAVARREAGYGFTSEAAADFARARLPARRHRRLRHERSRCDLRGCRTRRRGDRRRSSHGAGGGHGASGVLARESVPHRFDVPVSRHGVGRSDVLRRRVGADRAARSRLVSQSPRAGRPRPARSRRARHGRGHGAAQRRESDPHVARHAPAAGQGAAGHRGAARVGERRSGSRDRCAHDRVEARAAVERAGSARCGGAVAVAAARGRTTARRARGRRSKRRTPSAARSKIASSKRSWRGSRAPRSGPRS